MTNDIPIRRILLVTITTPSRIGDPDELAVNGSPPDGFLGVPYFFAYTVTGGEPPYTYQITSGLLPYGLIMDPITGIFSGVPTNADPDFNPWLAAIKVQDSAGTAVFADSIINITTATLIIQASAPDGEVGLPYEFVVNARFGLPGYTFSFADDALPAGLTLNAKGLLSGTPTTAQTKNPTLIVTDADSNTSDQSPTIQIFAALTGSGAYGSGTISVPYTDTSVSASNGKTPYVYSYENKEETIPGLAIDPATAILSGTPTAIGHFVFNVLAVDALGAQVLIPQTVDIFTDKADRVLHINSVDNDVDSFYNLQLTDEGIDHVLVIDATTAFVIQVKTFIDVPFPVGSVIPMLVIGFGVITVAADFGVTLNSTTGTFDSIAQYSSLTLTNIAEDRWILTGDLAPEKANRVLIINEIDDSVDSTYNVQLSDDGIDRLLRIDAATAFNVLIPPAFDLAFPKGAVIPIIVVGAGVVSFSAAGGVTFNSSTGSFDSGPQYAALCLVNLDTDIWILTGERA